MTLPECDTFDCEYTATRWATWRNAAGELCGGVYCRDCAERLERAGDEVGVIGDRPAAA